MAGSSWDRPYFKLYPKHLLADEDTQIMDATEFGAYVLLLCIAWHSEPPCTIPNDEERLSRLARLSPDEWADRRAIILAPWTENGDRFVQKRLLREFQEMEKAHATRSESGRLGGSKAKRKKRSSKAKAPLEQSSSNQDSGSGSESGSTALEKAKHRVTAAEVDQVYAEYPRKIAPKEAKAEIRRAIEAEGFEFILERTKAFADSWAGQQGKFTVHPQRWYKRGRYHDDPAEWEERGTLRTAAQSNGTTAEDYTRAMEG